MSPRSSAGPVSSRTFQLQDMENAIKALPTSQGRYVRKLARDLHNLTGMGYYAALDMVAVVGLKISNTQISTNSS